MMSHVNVVSELSASIPPELAKDVVDYYTQLRQDVASAMLGRSAPGKFVETLVQILQFLENGKYDQKPNVDDYLKGLESRSAQIDDGLRICAARVGRAMFTLRNKRNIAHKGEVDPNMYDLRFLFAGAQWVLTELVRKCTRLTMEEAGKIVEQVQEPMHPVVEQLGARRIVLSNSTVRQEILVLLHSSYPEEMTLESILSSLNRRKAATVKKCVRLLWNDKAIDGLTADSYKLTRKGRQEITAFLMSRA